MQRNADSERRRQRWIAALKCAAAFVAGFVGGVALDPQRPLSAAPSPTLRLGDISFFFVCGVLAETIYHALYAIARRTQKGMPTTRPSATTRMPINGLLLASLGLGLSVRGRFFGIGAIALAAGAGSTLAWWAFRRWLTSSIDAEALARETQLVPHHQGERLLTSSTKRKVIAISIFAIALLSFLAFSNRVSEEMVSVVSDTLRDCKSIEQEFGPLEAVHVKLLNRNGKAVGETSHHFFSIEAKYATEAIDMRVELKGQTGVWRLEKLEPRSGSPRFAALLTECLLRSGAAQQ